MSYLVDTPSIKKRFCKHEFKILYPNGSNNPVEHCNKCKISRMPKTKNESLIRHICPASEPSKPNYFEEHQFMTNWYAVQHDGWHLPGTKEPHDWCGLWQSRGCLNVGGHHHPECKNKIYLKQYQRSCY